MPAGAAPAGKLRHRILAALLMAAASGKEALPVSDFGLSGEELRALQQQQDLLCIEHGRIWLARYAEQARGVRALFEKRHQAAPPSGITDAAGWVDEILPREILRSPDGEKIIFDNANQRDAVMALSQARVGVLTGGPGTGKTTTAAALLAVYKRMHPALKPDDILVAAPTGKAACRIGESIAGAVSHLKTLQPEESEFLRAIRAKTLHRALDWRPVPAEKGGPFQRNAQRRLECRLVIVDEASMVDLSLMHALVEALPEECPLILLGDADQLESVEAGGVLAELVRRGCRGEAGPGSGEPRVRETPPAPGDSGMAPLPGLAHQLRYSRRAMNAPWILELAGLVRPGTRHTLEQVSRCVERHPENLFWHKRTTAGLRDRLLLSRWRQWKAGAEEWTSIVGTANADRMRLALAELSKFQLLCATNAQVDRANAEGVAILCGEQTLLSGSLPHGCPLLIHANAHALGLTNGDVGIALSTEREKPASLAIFPSPAGVPLCIPIAQLPQHGPAFAITIHKSQGSEWSEVAVELPRHGNAELLSKNLLYTAVTRASVRVELIGTEQALRSVLEPMQVIA